MIHISFYDSNTGRYIKQWPNWSGVVPALGDVVVLHYGDNNEEKCCGNCCWFKHEDFAGFGICYGSKFHMGNDEFPRCNHSACDKYVSNEEMRHHMAVLLQANRYRRDQHVPSIYRMPDPKELGEAIDFSLEYMNVFSLL